MVLPSYLCFTNRACRIGESSCFLYSSITHCIVPPNVITFVSYKILHEVNMENFQRREDILQDAIDLLNNEQFDECVAITRKLMAQHLPWSQKIYCHTLLATAVDDWYEGEVGITWRRGGRTVPDGST